MRSYGLRLTHGRLVGFLFELFSENRGKLSFRNIHSEIHPLTPFLLHILFYIAYKDLKGAARRSAAGYSISCPARQLLLRRRMM